MQWWKPLLGAMILASCSSEAARFDVQPLTSDATIRSSARTVSITEVSLPGYSEESTIGVQSADGEVVGIPDAIWADDPDRVLSNTLVRNLTVISGAQVAAEPWPLDGLPDAEVTVRVERMSVSQDNVLNFDGQFAIRREDYPSRSRLQLFNIEVPVEAVTPSAVLRAHDTAWRQLAEAIARSL